MKLPEYVTKEEVRGVCKKLKLRDWTIMRDPKISLKEAKIPTWCIAKPAAW